MSMNRREAIKAAALVGTGVVTSGTLVINKSSAKPLSDPVGEKTRRSLTVLKNVPARANEDVLIRMQRELVTAMNKPVEQRRWIMVIDTRKCVGCHACTIGCVAENKLPPGVVYRPVITEELGEFPNVQLRFTPRPCMQCEEPPCVPVCPVTATWRRPDGITVVDYDKCIGCRYCITACPYNARTTDRGAFHSDYAAEGSDSIPLTIHGKQESWETKPTNEYGKGWTREDHDSPVGNARKCHFCLHRLEVGELPMCATTCIGRATYFGDANDADSLVVELITKNQVKTLLSHLGTKPRVYYIV